MVATPAWIYLAYAIASVVFYGIFGALLMFNPSGVLQLGFPWSLKLGGLDMTGVWFKPGSFFPLWKVWTPMTVMIARAQGTAMLGAFPVGFLVLPASVFLYSSTLLHAIYFGFYLSAAFDDEAVVESFRLLLIPSSLLACAGFYLIATGAVDPAKDKKFETSSLMRPRRSSPSSFSASLGSSTPSYRCKASNPGQFPCAVVVDLRSSPFCGSSPTPCSSTFALTSLWRSSACPSRRSRRCTCTSSTRTTRRVAFPSEGG
jgi:hypothetical protein